MTVPNLLTFTRILLTPLLMWFLLNHKINLALVVFFIAGLTDVLDGLIQGDAILSIRERR